MGPQMLLDGSGGDDGTTNSVALLDQLCREMRFLAEVVVDDIRDGLLIQRRPLSEWTKTIYVRVSWLRRNGLCPCCQEEPVCSESTRIQGAEFDHFYARHRNRAEETWLVCGACNQRLESSTEFKAATRSAFEAYQAALRPFLECGQGKLFAA